MILYDIVTRTLPHTHSQRLPLQSRVIPGEHTPSRAGTGIREWKIFPEFNFMLKI